MEIRPEQREKLMILRLCGSVTSWGSADWLRGDLESATQQHIEQDGRAIVFDLSEADFQGNGCYADFFTVCRDAESRLRVAVVVGSNQSIRQGFYLTKLDRYLKCFETESDAIRFLEFGEHRGTST